MARLYLKSGNSWTQYSAKEAYKKQGGEWIKTDFSALLEKNYLYENIENGVRVNYISLGDSIAAGHAINRDWQTYYGTGSQYESNGNTQTAIVPGCYTDLITKELRTEISGLGNVSVKSYAESGDRIDDLMQNLSNPDVIAEIQKSNLITICIGANDVLEPAMSHLEQYVNAGDAALAEISAIVNNNLINLANDSYAYSITALLNRLNAINPDATYIFTTIYNPYKYLWLDDGVNGFFKPLLDTIPQMNIDVDGAVEDVFNIDDLGYYDILKGKWQSIELNYDLDNAIKEGLLNTSIVRKLYSRVNGLCNYSESLVVRLNEVLVNKINAYGKSNFKIVDTKAQFDLYPDRTAPGDIHYNDLVNVEFTRGYDVYKMDWGALWRDKYGTSSDAAVNYWTDLAWKYLSFNNALPSLNVADYVSFNINGFADELIPQIVDKIIAPTVDPHPKSDGHNVLKQTFLSAFDMNNAEHRTITFNPGANATGTMTPYDVVVIDKTMTPYVAIPKMTFNANTGYYFTGWLGSDGKTYADGAGVALTSNLTLTAQWSNLYKVTYMHSNHTNLYGDDETGHKECYEFWIDGVQQPKFSKFKDGSSTDYTLAYGTPIGVICRCYNPTELTYDDKTCRIYVNDMELASGYREVAANIPGGVLGNMIIDFRWKIAGSIATLNAQSWEDCHITIY